MYWGNGSSIGAANLDGSSKVFSLPIGGSSALMTQGQVCGVAVDGTHLYWSENGVISRLDLNGGSAAQPLVGGAAGTCGVAVDGTHLYWPSGGGSIGRANLDGSAANPSFITGGQQACGVAVDGAHVYWVDRAGGRLGRAGLDGSDVEHGFIDDLMFPCGLAVDDGHVYWGEHPGSIGRAELDGGEVDREFITGAGEAWGVAVHGAHVYWTDRGNALGTVGRANLDGTAANREFVVSNQAGAFGVAVDSRTLPPTRVSRAVAFGKLSHDRRKGFVYLTVKVPARGSLQVRSAGLHGRFLDDQPPAWAGGPFESRLKLRAAGKGRVAQRIRRQLRRNGRAPAMFQLTYQEENALPITVGRQLALLRRTRGAPMRQTVRGPAGIAIDAAFRARR